MGAEDAWTAVYGEKVAEILLEREGEITARQVRKELSENYDAELSTRAVDGILSNFEEEGLVDRESSGFMSRNSTYLVNGAAQEDYDRVVDSSARSF
jgi:Fe2+ or Zn2+ uptake regulation protein